MAFTEETVKTAFDNAGGKCEKCKKQLSWENRGREGWGKWEAHHKNGNPDDDRLANCQIICWDCHKATF